jgi:hypothetical protein
MANLTLRRRKSKKQRALQAAGSAAKAAPKVIKARIAWLFGKKATKVAVPAAAAAGTAAVVAKKRFSRDETPPHPASMPTNQTPAGVA